MASSSYYYGLMTQYDRQKRRIEEKKESYSNFLNKLNNIKSTMSSPKELLQDSYNTFKNGGYYDGGTPSRGKLTEVCGDIDNAITSLGNIITKTQKKIDEFTSEISDLKSKYEEAQRNYNNAKRQENS